MTNKMKWIVFEESMEGVAVSVVRSIASGLPEYVVIDTDDEYNTCLSFDQARFVAESIMRYFERSVKPE